MTRGSKLKALALGALVCAAGSPALAQVVVGGSSPSVEINWGVLDQLGPEPSLPGLLHGRAAAPPRAAVPHAAQPKGVTFKPYRPEPRPKDLRKPAPVAAKADKAAADQLLKDARAHAHKESRPVAKAEPKAAPAPARPPRPDVPAEVPEPPKAETAKAPKVKVPEVALPSTPAPEKPAAVASAPMPIVPETKVEAPTPEIPKAEPPRPAQVVKAEPPPPAPAAVQPAPAPAPAPAPVPAPAVQPPAAPQQAALPPAAAVVRKGDTLSVMFSGENARLPDAARSELDAVAKRMEKDEGLSLQLLAYADGDDANASKARRLSLSRALEVRKYLMELGVRSTRIEVRALGNKSEGGPADRVDAVLVSR